VKKIPFAYSIHPGEILKTEFMRFLPTRGGCDRWLLPPLPKPLERRVLCLHWTAILRLKLGSAVIDGHKVNWQCERLMHSEFVLQLFPWRTYGWYNHFRKKFTH
jgi:hypothetical protein